MFSNILKGDRYNLYHEQILKNPYRLTLLQYHKYLKMLQEHHAVLNPTCSFGNIQTSNPVFYFRVIFLFALRQVAQSLFLEPHDKFQLLKEILDMGQQKPLKLLIRGEEQWPIVFQLETLSFFLDFLLFYLALLQKPQVLPVDLMTFSKQLQRYRTRFHLLEQHTTFLKPYPRFLSDVSDEKTVVPEKKASLFFTVPLHQEPSNCRYPKILTNLHDVLSSKQFSFFRTNLETQPSYRSNPWTELWTKKKELYPEHVCDVDQMLGAPALWKSLTLASSCSNFFGLMVGTHQNNLALLYDEQEIFIQLFESFQHLLYHGIYLESFLYYRQACISKKTAGLQRKQIRQCFFFVQKALILLCSLQNIPSLRESSQTTWTEHLSIVHADQKYYMGTPIHFNLYDFQLVTPKEIFLRRLYLEKNLRWTTTHLKNHVQGNDQKLNNPQHMINELDQTLEDWRHKKLTQIPEHQYQDTWKKMLGHHQYEEKQQHFLILFYLYRNLWMCVGHKLMITFDEMPHSSDFMEVAQ